MTNYCKICGVSIPEDQDVCSICYGDPNYGNDGYYKYILKEKKNIEKNNRAENFG